MHLKGVGKGVYEWLDTRIYVFTSVCACVKSVKQKRKDKKDNMWVSRFLFIFKKIIVHVLKAKVF